MRKTGSLKFRLINVLAIFSLILTACNSNEASDSYGSLSTLESDFQSPSVAPESGDWFSQSVFYSKPGDRESSCSLISTLQELLNGMDIDAANSEGGITREQFLKYAKEFSEVVVREKEFPNFVSAVEELNSSLNKIEGKAYSDLKLAEFKKTWCEKPWGKAKTGSAKIPPTGKYTGPIPYKPEFIEKCRLQTPEGGMYDRQGWLLPFDRICEMVPNK